MRTVFKKLASCLSVFLQHKLIIQQYNLIGTNMAFMACSIREIEIA